MAVALINPDGHVVVPDYHHVAVATGGKQIHIAGQVAWDGNGTLVAPGDLTGQVAQVYRNVAKALAAAGATFADVVRFTWYAAGWRREMYDAFRAGVEQAVKELDITTAPPAALIGVEILFDPEILVEAEVTAVVDR
ncbi:RidA family protein [Amycolatopsis sp. NPDC051371]|uniref:RidA family protein n=1 Tax=Amycolatopsis sp. NPDC051371 TaxID=3155800 RepID=UPI0034462A18